MFLKSYLTNFFLFSLVFLFGCVNNENSASKANNNDIETQEMVELLKKINSEGNPQMYYHWNKKLAEYHKKNYENPQKKKKLKIGLATVINCF